MNAENAQTVNGKIQNKRINSIQALKGCAILGIFTSHCGLTLLGQWGVSVFLMISGFIMIYSYGERELGCSIRDNISFSLKKIKKQYPLHIIFMLAALVLSIYSLLKNFSIHGAVNEAIKVALNITLLQTWVPAEEFYFSLNGVAWYLSVYLFLCLLFPYINKKIKSYTSRRCAVSAIAIIFSIQILAAFLVNSICTNLLKSDNDDFVVWFTYICPLFRLGDFAIGCNLGYLFLHRDKSKATDCGRLTALEIAAIVLAVVAQIGYNKTIGMHGSQWFRYTLAYIPSSAMLVYCFALNDGFISKALTNRALVYVGNLSPVIFIIHQVIIRYFEVFADNVMHISVNVWIETAACFALTIIASIILKRSKIPTL